MKILYSILATLAILTTYHFIFNNERIPLGFITNEEGQYMFVGFTDKEHKFEEYHRDTTSAIVRDGAGKIQRDSASGNPIVKLDIVIDTLYKTRPLDSIAYKTPLEVIDMLRSELANTNGSLARNNNLTSQIAQEFNKMITRVERIDPGGKIE